MDEPFTRAVGLSVTFPLVFPVAFAVAFLVVLPLVAPDPDDAFAPAAPPAAGFSSLLPTSEYRQTGQVPEMRNAW